MTEDERNLWKRYGEGDPQARADLLLFYIPLTYFWAKRIGRLAPWTSLEDLRQEGVIALLKAIEKFDSDRGAEFKIYARIKVREALFDYLQAERNITDYQYRQYRKVNRANETLMRLLGRRPTFAEIAAEAKLSEQQVENALDAMAIAYAEDLADFDTDLLRSSATVENQETVILIDKLLARLDERARRILTEYYYMGRTDSEIAELSGLKSGHVKRIRHRALEKLAKSIEGRHPEN
jgi:RNA polymerase sigma factor FliA